MAYHSKAVHSTGRGIAPRECLNRLILFINPLGQHQVQPPPPAGSCGTPLQVSSAWGKEDTRRDGSGLHMPHLLPGPWC